MRVYQKCSLSILQTFLVYDKYFDMQVMSNFSESLSKLQFKRVDLKFSQIKMQMFSAKLLYLNG